MSKMGSADHKSEYHSPLRDEQKEATRRRILEALVRVIAQGPASVTVPAVAREAGVSVPTVYRHFGDKEGLIDGLTPLMGEMLDIGPESRPVDREGVDEFIRHLFRRLDGADPVVRAALASGAAVEARRRSAAFRADAIVDLFAELEPELSDEDLERFSKVAVILTCSEALRLWQDRFDVDSDEAAEHVIWAIRRIIAGSTVD